MCTIENISFSNKQLLLLGLVLLAICGLVFLVTTKPENTSSIKSSKSDAAEKSAPVIAPSPAVQSNPEKAVLKPPELRGDEVLENREPSRDDEITDSEISKQNRQGEEISRYLSKAAKYNGENG